MTFQARNKAHGRKPDRQKMRKEPRKRESWTHTAQEPRWYLHRRMAPRRSCESGLVFDVIQDFLLDNPGCEVHIGTDSKRYGQHVVFATAVVLYRERMGGRVMSRLRTKEYTHRPETVARLWEEVTEAMEIAEVMAELYLPFCGQLAGMHRQLIHVHLDLNSKDECVSNKVYKPGMSWVRSAGYVAHGKPAAWAASGVANRLTNQALVYR